ncbi:MAG: S1C family serine protease [Myxococcota bacterium]
MVLVETDSTSGSGFFIGEDLVVTCLHVVRGRENVKVRSAGWQGVVIGVVAWSESDDAAVLRVAPRALRRGLRLSSAKLSVGTKVVVVSSPLGLENTVSEGILSNLRTAPSPRIQFTAAISPGSSGGPIFSSTSGEVIGLVSGTLTSVEGGRTYGQNLNFGVPASSLFSALRSARSDVPLAVFAAQTLPEAEKRWRELEAGLPSLERAFISDLGERVGAAFGTAMRHTIEKRDADGMRALTARRDVLKKERQTALEVAEAVARTGAIGQIAARQLLVAWEDNIIEGTDESRERLESAKTRARSVFAEYENVRRAAMFPEKVAGFPFKVSFTQVYEFCYPGYTASPVTGLGSLTCPTVPIPVPFASGGADLTFLNGSLVAVHLAVTSYSDAVRIVGEKYGTPVLGVYRNGSWLPSDTRSFGPNTMFEWELQGGRIRVGRTSGRPFAAFIHADRDDAVRESF